MIPITLSTLQPLLSSPHSSSSSESLENNHRPYLKTFENGGHQNPESPRFYHFKDQEDPHQAIQRYKELEILHNGVSFSKLAFAPVLKACSKAYALSPGKQIHAQSIKYGLSSDIFIQTSLLTMYSSCGHFDTVFKVFDKMPQRNSVTWTAMMDACLRVEQPAKTVSIFHEMQRDGVKPDHFSIVSLLSACSKLGVLNLGKWVHAYIEKTGLGLTVYLGTALIDMYCKCGGIDDAYMVFNSMPWKSIQSWNAMLHGLSVHGHGVESLKLFSEMERDGRVKPNEVTFVGVLCGCSHCGLVQEGKFYFNLMQSKYGIKPSVKHYGCLVDLLGRAGLLDEAFQMVIGMPFLPNIIIWGSLLSACRIQNNMGMAERVSQKIIQQDSLQGDTSHYVIMSNMYAKEGLKDKMLEARMKIGKKPKGKSWIEIGCGVHEFSIGDFSHPEWEKIKVKLDEVMRRFGREDGKDESLENPHSEKVAVAFGLVTTNSPSPIRIIKNLRICEDCHGVMKLISESYGREIVLRDCTRFHRFVGGRCSCNDYW